MEGNPPEEAGAGRARADTAEGNVSTINLYDLGNTGKQRAFINLVRGRAKRFLHTGRDFNELVNVGMVGLAHAIEGFNPGANNGLAAYAIPWIDGEIRRFCNKSYWTVPGERNERGKHLPIASRIEHFGNVAIGDGSYKPDVSINTDIASDGEHGDDEAGGGTFLDEVVDRSLEDITGDRWRRIEQRLSERESRILGCSRVGKTNKEIGAELGVSGEAVRQVLVAIKTKLRHAPNEAHLFAWLDHDAKVFRREFHEYCRKGIGHLYRGRQQPRMSRSLISHNKLYVEPAWTKHKETGHCICLKCCPTKLGPSECYTSHKAGLSTFERTAAGWAPKKTNSKDPTWVSAALGYGVGTEKDDDKGPQAWTGWRRWKRSPQPKWKVKARKTINGQIRHADYKVRPIQPERKKPWSKPTVSTLASLCYSSDVSLTPLSPPPVTTTAVRPLTSAKLLQRNSNATA